MMEPILRGRLEPIEAKRDKGQTVVEWASDESEAEAFARAKAAGVKLRGAIVVIKRFCLTVADIVERDARKAQDKSNRSHSD